MKLTKNMTQGNVYKSYLLYAAPLLLSYLLTQLYSTVDAVVAGKFISEYALGAISATGSYENLFYSLFNGFAAGFGIYIAQQFGKGDFSAVKRDIASNTAFIAGLTVIVSVFSVIFRDPIMKYLNVDPVLWKDAEIYFVIYTLGWFLSYANRILMQGLYALGCTSFSLYVSFIAAVFKIGGNLLAVLVFDMGVGGLALFSVLSNAVTTVCYLFLLRRAYKELPTEKGSFGFQFSGIRNSLRYAGPTAVQQVAFHGVGLLIAPSINNLGAAATTAFNVSTRLYNIGTMSLWAVSNAFTCYTAQCVGQGSYEKIRKGLKAGFVLNCIMMIPFVLIPLIFAKPIVSIFFPTGFTGDAFDYSMRYVIIYLPMIYVQLVGHVLHSYMRSLGFTDRVLYITLICSTVRVVATILLVDSMHIEGAYLAQVISWAVDAVISVVYCYLFYRTNSQLKAIVDRVRQEKQ